MKKHCVVCGREVTRGTGCYSQKHLVHKGYCKGLLISNPWRYIDYKPEVK